MRGDKNIRRAGKGAAASRAYDALSGSESAHDAATAAHHVASQGGKEAVSHAAKHPWHTAPWESAKAAFGAKGAAVLAVVGGATAVGLVSVATVALAGGGGKGGDDGVDASLSQGDKGGDVEIGSGGKDGTTSTTDADGSSSTTSTTTTGSSTTSTTAPGGRTTTTQRSTTPGGPTTTRGGTTPTTRPPTTTTRPPATTTTTTRPAPPTIRAFTAKRGTGPCQIRGQVLVVFTWSGVGTVTSGGVTVTKTGAVVHSGITKPSGTFSHCVDVTSPSWTLTLFNGNSSATKVAPLT